MSASGPRSHSLDSERQRGRKEPLQGLSPKSLISKQQPLHELELEPVSESPPSRTRIKKQPLRELEFETIPHVAASHAEPCRNPNTPLKRSVLLRVRETFGCS
jgi:hypothetical protein